MTESERKKLAKQLKAEKSNLVVIEVATGISSMTMRDIIKHPNRKRHPRTINALTAYFSAKKEGKEK